MNLELKKIKNNLVDHAISVIRRGIASSINCVYADEESDKENSRITNLYWKLVKDIEQISDSEVWELLAKTREKEENKK